MLFSHTDGCEHNNINMNLAEDKLLLNYNDACIYSSDLSLLENSSSWLNDACINFQMTRLQNKEENDKSSMSMLFVDPCVISYLMHQCQDDDEIIDLSNNLQLCKKNIVFIPINDNNGESFQSTMSNGNHWSLLLVILSNSDNKVHYLHFDSSKRYNCSSARIVSKKISYLLMLSDYEGDTEVVNVIECKTPQQRNGYDCGVFVLALTEILSSLEDIKTIASSSTHVFSIGTLVKHCEEVIEGMDDDINFGINIRKRIANDIQRLILDSKEKKDTGVFL